MRPFLALRSYLPADHPNKGGEIGLEATPAEYIDTLLRVTVELRRVLAPHGSLCVELGDTYSGAGGYGSPDAPNPAYGKDGFVERWEGRAPKRFKKADDGWPLAKSRTLIPELYRVALAYGINPLTGEESPAGTWRVRNVVTWARPNPPVGALGDKWRNATSDVVVACTSDRRYWDDIATRRPHSPNTHARNAKGVVRRDNTIPSGQRDGNWDTLPISDETNPAGAPLLDWWEIPPGGYTGSHYAVFPPALVEPLVKAMAPPRVCVTCGEPSRRIVSEPEYVKTQETNNPTERGTTRGVNGGGADPTFVHGRANKIQRTLGWTDCGHGDNWRPAHILDPFAGSGTTGVVGTGHGHDVTMIDLDERNAELARERIGPLLFDGPHRITSRDDARSDAPLDLAPQGSPVGHQENRG